MEQSVSQIDTQITNAPDVQKISMEANSYSKTQKAAIIIALLGVENAKSIVEELDEPHVQNIFKAMQTIRFIPRPVLLATIAEFVTDLQEAKSGLHGGRNEAKKLAEELLSTDRAKDIFGDDNDEKEDKQAGQNIWQRLAKEKTDNLVDFLQTQRAEFIGLVLMRLDSVKAGEIMAGLSEDIASQTARFISSNIKLDEDVESAAIELLEQEYFAIETEDDGSLIAGFMADLMVVLPKARREKLMDDISKSNPDTAEKIKKGLLTFEDLPKRLPKSAVPIIFRDYDAKELMAALKAGQSVAPETVEFLFANISQRMAEQFKEDIEELKDLSEKQAEKAINGLMGFISRLQKSGQIAYIDVEEDDK